MFEKGMLIAFEPLLFDVRVLAEVLLLSARQCNRLPLCASPMVDDGLMYWGIK